MTEKISIVYSPKYLIDLYGLQNSYVFDVNKYRKVTDKLISDGLWKKNDFLEPATFTDEQLLLVHTKEYLQSLKNPVDVAYYLEFPQLSQFDGNEVYEKVVTPFKINSSGTLLAGYEALKKGIGINIGGGFHHAKPNTGAGFCLFADVAITIRQLKKEKKINRPLIVDLDLHQGDGNAIIFLGDDSVFTFSMHEQNNFPIPKAKSDLDIGLEFRTPGHTYLKLLKENLPSLINKHKPDIIFYVAGTDVFQKDSLGNLDLTFNDIVQRDLFVVSETRRNKIPLVMVLAGGYSEKSWEIHCKSISEIIKQYGK